MNTYIADFEYEDNGRNTMGGQSYMFDAVDICEAARIAVAFRAALARHDDLGNVEIKSIKKVIGD